MPTVGIRRRESHLRDRRQHARYAAPKIPAVGDFERLHVRERGTMKQLTEEQKTDLAARKQDQIKYVEWLNGVLAGRTIERIEMGETAGWLLTVSV